MLFVVCHELSVIFLNHLFYYPSLSREYMVLIEMSLDMLRSSLFRVGLHNIGKNGDMHLQCAIIGLYY